MAENDTTFNTTFAELPKLNITIDFNLTTEDGNITKRDVPFYLNFRDEPWVIPVVALSMFNIAAIIIFEIFVLYKSCGGRRHLLMGQILLLGLLLCSLLGLTYVPQPHWLFCGIARAGVGIAYAIVYGTLLVKCIFLLKLHHGVYFNASFQGLLLFFVVAVEVVVITQWLIYEPPNTTLASVSGHTSPVCEKTPVEKIQYLVYDMFLLFLVIVASIRARTLRENNKEAVYIGVAIGFSLILWVAWTSLCLIFDRRYEAPAEALGLSCTALIVFLLVFIPKAVQLCRPRQELSSSSHSVIHTPSFLHLQPQAILPGSGQGTLIKQTNANPDYCRNYPSRFWRYDYPSFQQMEPPAIVSSDMNSLKKSTGSFNHSHLY
ncbi:metabotropic glutamate receptor-like [Uloborus diversus]|uniref:metabotropic glutamate receptor-like n=1 Tax=Uloborus diversus TaxID=327109 RepID=UPI0024099C0A|nr:metabotropic glutamate receptor-like [Uloborus diversus]